MPMASSTVQDHIATRTAVTGDSLALRRPGLALVSLGQRGHARRPIGIGTNSLGSAPEVSPAHTRGRPPSTSIRGRGSSLLAAYVARITQRCNGRALNALRLRALTVF